MAELKKHVDSLMVIPNDKLYTIFKKDITFVDAFRYADDVLRQAIQGVSDVICVPGSINLDFADVATIMRNKGLAHMGIGTGRGANKTLDAVRQAVTSQLLETSIEGATGILMNVTGGKDLTISEVYEAADLVRDVADPNCNVIFGANFKDNMQGETIVTIIATGFEQSSVQKTENQIPEFKDNRINLTPFEQITPEPLPEMNRDELEEEIQKRENTVEDISVGNKKPVVDEDSIPPFLRKLRK